MAGKRNKNKSENGGGGAPMWIVTFSDLMSLLLTFFVLLLSFSSVQDVEFKKALGSLKGALGVLPKKEVVFSPFKTDFPKAITDQRKKFNAAAEKLREKLKAMDHEAELANPNKSRDNFNAQDKFQEDSKSQQDQQNLLKDEGMLEMIDIQGGKNGMVIRIDSPLLYALGEARLKPTAFPVLDAIVSVVADWPNTVRIEGHTDDLPINTPEFPSNWELSAARALSVLRYFESSRQIDPKRLSALGYGEHHPIFPNTTAINRAKNRRVEIYVEPPKDQPMVNYDFKEQN